MATASLIHPTVGEIDFVVAMSPFGWPIDVANAQEEELTSPGVDGKRWRTMQKQETQFQWSTISDCATFAAAITLGQNCLKCKDGQGVTVTTTVNGAVYRYRNVHVLDVAPTAMPGVVTGSGTTGTGQAHLNVVWTLILMDTTTQGETG